MPHNSSMGAPTAADLEAMRQMAANFAEGFARMGHDGPRILRMFQNPFYSAPYRLYRALGHAAASAVIDRCVAARGGGRVSVSPTNRMPSSPA